MPPMPMLDYAALYETQIRPRQRRQRLIRHLSIVLVALGPMLVARAVGLA